MTTSFLDIDGSQGEGGGQILRSSLALALLTGKPFRLHHIRAGRAKPGLHAQHLTSVRAAAAVGQADVKGASLGSSELTFVPGAVTGGSYHFSIGTAGATALVLHTVYLPLALRGQQVSKVTISGGTHVRTSPCYDFLERTWNAYLRHIGLPIALTLQRRGFFPRGGGVLDAAIEPVQKLDGLLLSEMPRPAKITGFAAVANLPLDVAEREIRRVRQRFRDSAHRRLSVELEVATWSGGPGNVLALQVETEPVPTVFTCVGERGKRAEAVADDAVDEALAFLDAAHAGVDPHSADQLVLPLAFAAGPSSFAVSKVTAHLTTNITVIRRFLERDIRCEGAEGAAGQVVIS